MHNDITIFKGKRRIIGGRQIVRNSLYMYTLSAVRVKNNVFQDVCQINKNRKTCKTFSYSHC